VCSNEESLKANGKKLKRPHCELYGDENVSIK
jgi:hypothetical protein